MAGISDPQTLQAGPGAGALFENTVVMDILKSTFNHNSLCELYFWRDSHQLVCLHRELRGERI